MKVILKDYLRKIGDVGDIVDVKEGYARNFLLPHDLAIPAIGENLKQIENLKRRHHEKESHLLDGFNDMAVRLADKSVVVEARVNEAGRLYGSVAEKEIAAALNSTFNTAVSPEHVEIPAPYKEPGDYEVHLRFTVGIGADVSLQIVPEGQPLQENSADSPAPDQEESAPPDAQPASSDDAEERPQ
ncbi:MAG: 50S ribosomal protein L9 [Planctomycetes bacterium]|nr:50S ribosomal protein L9 [Planctomycetota bacterium]